MIAHCRNSGSASSLHNVRSSNSLNMLELQQYIYTSTTVQLQLRVITTGSG